ncbi:MAG: uroporphyrinogen decarboxylase family protein [Candidatus Bathyarchaeia archaeon]
MNVLERLLAVFSRKKPDVMPWFADLTYWYKAKSYKNELPSKYLGESGQIRLYRKLGCGSHEELYNLPGEVTYYGIKRINSLESFDDGTKVFEEKYSTPLGDIFGVTKFVPQSFSSAHIKYPVATKQDLRVIQYIYKNQEFKSDYAIQHDKLKKWRGIGLVSSLPPRTPFQRMIVEWAGVTNTIMLMMKEREEFEETLQIMAEADDSIYEAVCESPAPAVYFGENITSDVISPSIFKRYHMPYYKKRVNQLHAAGKFIYVHIDGTLRGVLPLIEFTNIDCAQSITPAPVGDINVEKLREAAGQNIILWGGLPGVYFSHLYPEKNLRQMALKVIKYHLEGYKFIMGVADQVPPDGDINRVKNITEIIEKHARY